MPMLQGTVTINPANGAIVASTGAASVVFTALDSAQDYGTLAVENPPAYGTARSQIASIANAVASIIPYIQSNAVVSTTVATAVAAGIPVLVAYPAGTGATTAPGTGSGSGSGTVA